MLKAPNWPNKRAALRHHSKISDHESTLDVDEKSTELFEPTNNSSAIETTNKSSKLWSLVSSMLRFASLTPNDTSQERISASEQLSTESNLDISEISSSPFIIKRCASFAGK